MKNLVFLRKPFLALVVLIIWCCIGYLINLTFQTGISHFIAKLMYFLALSTLGISLTLLKTDNAGLNEGFQTLGLVLTWFSVTAVITLIYVIYGELADQSGYLERSHLLDVTDYFFGISSILTLIIFLMRRKEKWVINLN